MNRSVVVLSEHTAVCQTNHMLHQDSEKIILVFQLFNWNSIMQPLTTRRTRGRISYISTRSWMQKYMWCVLIPNKTMLLRASTMWRLVSLPKHSV